jgi:hypothetical protein
MINMTKELAIAAVFCVVGAVSVQAQGNTRDPAFWEKFGKEIEETKIPHATPTAPESTEGETQGSREQAEENLNRFLEQKTQRDTLDKLNE